MRLQMFKIYEGAVKPPVCDELIGRFNNLREGMVGLEEAVLNRTDRISNIGAVSNNEPIAEYLFKLCSLTNQILSWDLDITGLEDLQLTEYGANGHYGWHTDCDPFVKTRGLHRKVTAVLMLSDPNEYGAGELELKGLPAMKLNRGDVIVFPSVLEHRVLPVSDGTRKTLVCWTTGPYFK